MAVALVEEIEEDTGTRGKERRVIERGEMPEKGGKEIELKRKEREREERERIGVKERARATVIPAPATKLGSTFWRTRTHHIRSSCYSTVRLSGLLSELRNILPQIA